MQEKIKQVTQVDLTQDLMKEIVQSATLSQESCSAKIIEARDAIEKDLETRVQELRSTVIAFNLDELEAEF